MTTPVVTRRKPRRRQLHEAEKSELIHGTDGESVFASDADRALMWREHGAEILAERPPGRRCWAWWGLDAAEPRNPAELEMMQLLRLGVLSDAERTALVRAAVGRTWLDPSWIYENKRGRSVREGLEERRESSVYVAFQYLSPRRIPVVEEQVAQFKRDAGMLLNEEEASKARPVLRHSL